MNVKKVDLTTDVDVHGQFELVVNARAAGPRLGKDVQTVIKAVKAGDWTENADGVVSRGGIELLPEEYTQRLVAAEPESTAALPDNAGLVVLDSAVTEELEAEGWARDRDPRAAGGAASRPASTCPTGSPSSSRCPMSGGTGRRAPRADRGRGARHRVRLGDSGPRRRRCARRRARPDHPALTGLVEDEQTALRGHEKRADAGRDDHLA